MVEGYCRPIQGPSGPYRKAVRSNGQTRAMARPTIEEILIGPMSLKRLSCEFVRLSPITNTRPLGTVIGPKSSVRTVGGQVGLDERAPVDHHVPVPPLDDVAGQADHPLDQLVVAAVAQRHRVEQVLDHAADQAVVPRPGAAGDGNTTMSPRCGGWSR